MDHTTRWREIDTKDWHGRISAIARLIPCGSVVLDVGAGTRELERKLPQECAYIPLDFMDRGQGTFLCDLNAENLPPFPKADIAVCGGVLEYVHDIERLFAHLATSADRIIASYAIADGGDKEHRKMRHANGWVNAHTASEITKALMGAGFSRVTIVGDWEAQRIFSARR